MSDNTDIGAGTTTGTGTGTEPQTRSGKQTGKQTAIETGIALDRIAEAARVIDPVFLNSPQYIEEQLCARLGRRVLTKVETLNPLRSFKGRGADYIVRSLARDATVVCASTGGNFGQAIAYAARSHGLSATVFVPADMSRVKLKRLADLGADVHPVPDARHAGPAAEAFAAAEPSRVLVVDGRDAAINEGAGSIGVELLRVGDFDTVVLPLGDGALITGVARWIKAHSPDVRIIGVGAAAAPAMLHSWRAGHVVATPRSSAFAAGIAINEPHPDAVRRVRALVDDIVLVEDAELATAMRLAAETIGVLLEPAGAAGLAAIAHHDIPGDVVATVLTGGNADLDAFPGWTPR
ncbi:threonine dehydratase [Nocardiopsis mwathae]|uniref:Threonine dehydratase n=1 Tax=Nocardiopsis mwathae TaxID=1472723 RepID=A0A7W9YDK2_9ACTN|nr:pyridoxal-phosphate dependent enzyme [Nocardiopsis mwathae]MBB6169995.1 threonine dehydratase [Nocardiopsis mwathae]